MPELAYFCVINRAGRVATASAMKDWPGEMMMIAMTKEEAASYARDGYILCKGLLSHEEVERFRDTARAQLERENREGAVMIKGDKEGKTTLLKMWTRAEDNQYGLLARDERLVNLAEDSIGKRVYLYSH
jgi:hypothetical protein